MFRRKRDTQDFAAEIEAHIELEAERLREQGMSAEDARAAAARAFGNVTRTKERFYESGRAAWLDHLWRDVRYAARMLRKSPGFTAVAVLTMALGIGANAVVFAVLNGVMLRPLDIPEPQNVYQLGHAKDDSANQSYPNYVDLRDRVRSFEGIAAYNIAEAGLNSGPDPARVWVVLATGNYFDTLRVEPHLGRFFNSADENGPNSAPYAVLSYSYWQSHFQGDRNVIGRVVQLSKHSFTIIGVAPRDFRGTMLFLKPDFFVPIVNQAQLESEARLDDRRKRWVFEVFGRLKSGVAPAQALAELNSVGADLERTYPENAGQLSFRLVRPGLYGDFLGRPVRAFVSGLMLLAALILLAACANLGSLFAARAADRGRELALRLALGGSRISILRQLLTEAVLISLLGGALGLWASLAILRGLSTWHPFPRFPLEFPLQADASVYVAALILAVVSGLLFGIVPLRQVQRADPYQIITSGGPASISRRISLRDVLLGAQVAICALLVTSSWVALRGLIHSNHSEYGFDHRNVLLVDTDLAMAGYRGASVAEMQKRMIAAVERVPGVAAVASTDWPPLSLDWQRTYAFKDAITDLRAVNATATVVMFKISPRYFEAAGTTLLHGRDFTWHDTNDAPPVAIVNQEFARRFFGSVEKAVGGFYKVREGTRFQVVGIVEDGKYTNLTEKKTAAMFLPTMQTSRSQTWLLVRSDRAAALAPDLRRALRELDAALPLSIQTWRHEMTPALFPSRIAAASLGVLGLLGAMLAITGIFGMAAYSVSKRLRELGIRIALGAARKEVLSAALGRAFYVLAIGTISGVLLGFLASRVLALIVYQATPRDPLVLAGVTFSMIVLGLLATWIPAHRALSIDPLKLLREE